MSRESYCARLTSPHSGITAELWLRASRSPVVHVCRDPRLSVLLSAFLLDPCPVAILVINGLGHRSPRACKQFDRFICSGPTQETRWTTLGPLTALPLQEGPSLAIGTTTRCALAHLAFPFEQAFRSILTTTHQGWQEPVLAVTA